MPDEACHLVPAGRVTTFMGRLIARVSSWLSPPAYRVDRTDRMVPSVGVSRRPPGESGVVGAVRSGPISRWRPPRPGRAARNSAGFTLVEIIIVLIIMGIAVAVAIPRMSSGADFQVTSAARMVAVDLQYAQNHAIASQKKVRAVFDPAAGTARGNYKLVYADTSVPIEHPINKGPYEVSFTQMKEFGALKLLSAAFGPGGANNYVEFDPIGAPDNSGSVVMQAGTVTYTVTVAAITGKVTVTAN